jgi:hypothetical protein
MNLRSRIFANLPGRHSLSAILSTAQLATKIIEYMEQTAVNGPEKPLHHAFFVYPYQ